MPQPGEHFHRAPGDPFGLGPQRLRIISYPPPAAESSAKTKEMTLLLVQASTRYREDFHAWLTDNYHVWERFKAEANKIRGAGWDHYSARTIIEVLRHESNLRDVGGRWKLNDWYTPDLARLYMELDSTADGFFEIRNRP